MGLGSWDLGLGIWVLGFGSWDLGLGIWVLGFGFKACWVLVRISVARTNFENLRVYQAAERLGDEVWHVCLEWDFFARDTLGKQLVRAADSIGANLAEGSGRGTLVDHRRFVRVARGSLYETKHWLRRAFRRKLLNTEQIDKLKGIIDDLTPLLNAYYRSLGTKPKFQPNPDGQTQDPRPKTQDPRPKT